MTMCFHLTMPARINLLGNPGDACQGDFAVISTAIDLRAGAMVEPAEELVLERLERREGDFEVAHRLSFDRQEIPLPYDGTLDLVKGAINRLYSYSATFRDRIDQRGVRFGTWTDVPRQSGLGGSSLLVLLTLAGLRAVYELDDRSHNDYVLAELAQRVEAKELGITCGYADRYVPLFGGLAYVDYRGKLRQQDFGEEPLATYERLDPWVDDLPLVVAYTGVERDSGDVHGRIRSEYLEAHEAWEERGGVIPRIVSFMSAAWETAWKGKLALLIGDWESFGELMCENHRVVDEMMSYCGISEGAGWANNRFIEAALLSGALGAKLTGAGGGGSVFALTRPGEEDALVEVWRQVAEDEGLVSAQIFRPRISREGLVVERA
jgi:galactokinase/mevalonate kinase-like predicted kinase